MSGTVPQPTPVFRFIHVGNLSTCLKRGGLHAPNATPSDGLAWRTIFNVELQRARGNKTVPCGPCGVLHDYVPFY
ncbi:MAG TPA: DUF4433 domain-containing protein, partial [Candidatus Hydrogenedentes bacterium]|nr:DUF4433 domain-containing protein [Candidatus Hydrogenedentota bacterium]